MQYDKLNYDLIDGIASIRLNDPATLNAISPAMGQDLLHALRRASNEARCIMIGGEGRAFCSGASLSEGHFDLNDPHRDVGARLDDVFNPVIMAMKNAPVPVITVVGGVAAGIGCGIAMAGDLVLCGESGYFFYAFRRMGLVPDGGSSWLLTQAVGRVRALRLMLLGEKLPAARAVEWGVATSVFPDDALHAEALAIARDMASGPRSLGLIKRVSWAAAEQALEATLALERRAQQEAGRSDDFAEGVAAFREKRPAQFQGR
jgi:2-(1,2-epoxy-1,2-dihydrophenyl)acetyl-CoA isomerase